VALPYEDADPLELYRYFPTFVKARDELAGVDGAGEAVLQKITYMLEKEAGAHTEMIRRLILDLDPDHCDVSRFDYLAFALGVPIPGDLTDEVRRQYLRQLPGLLKIKGTHLHFAKKAAFADHKDVWLVELFKTTLYEDRYYTREPDSIHDIKSARVDMLACSGSCESICESTCESGVQLEGAWVKPGLAEQILNEIGEVLPVHVVLRREAVYVEPTDGFFFERDSIGCHFYCEAVCESGCEGGSESWPGSYTEYENTDRMGMPRDSYQIEMYCVNTCESWCQTCCECGQEGTCEQTCELFCQLVCESVCQETCQATCQSVCQGSCQDACQLGCQYFSCEFVCETTCESLCEADIEA